jgi:hypothetical protein
MAKSEMQNVVMIMFTIISIFMFDFAHANDTPPPETIDKNVFSIALCVGKCGLKCSDHLGNEIQYAACVAGCGLKCRKSFLQIAYSRFNNNIGMLIFPSFIYTPLVSI